MSTLLRKQIYETGYQDGIDNFILFRELKGTVGFRARYKMLKKYRPAEYRTPMRIEEYDRGFKSGWKYCITKEQETGDLSLILHLRTVNPLESEKKAESNEN